VIFKARITLGLFKSDKAEELPKIWMPVMSCARSAPIVDEITANMSAIPTNIKNFL
jgi:hypothetical protein